MNGLIDLVVETVDGYRIVDHKSDQIEDALVALGNYQAQPGAYADALSRSGKNLLGTAVHLMRRGELILDKV